MVAEAARTAEISAGPNGWLADVAPDTSTLDRAARRSLAASWERDAAFEHASVASFSKLALELIAFGAPADLVSGALRAALDEVDHASTGFALAAAYGGSARAPNAFDAVREAPLALSLVELVDAAIREGCVGETIASFVVAAEEEAARDSAVSSALARIADDEARHAELSWRIVAWALSAGDAHVRDAARAAFEDAIAKEASALATSREPRSSDHPRMRDHGRLSDEETSRVRGLALSEVVAPCARALLGNAPFMVDA